MASEEEQKRQVLFDRLRDGHGNPAGGRQGMGEAGGEATVRRCEEFTADWGEGIFFYLFFFRISHDFSSGGSFGIKTAMSSVTNL